MPNRRFNDSVLKLWENTFGPDEDIYMPLVYPPFVHNPLLFIGSNPSFSLRGFKTFLGDTEHACVDPVKFWLWKNRSDFDLEKAMDMERLAKDKYAYFNKLRELSKYVGLAWEHIDLFFFRETNQNDFKKRIYQNNKISEFGNSQLELAKSLIREIDPKIIVVINAFASDVFQTQFKTEFDEELGFHKIRLDGRTVPVFLGSMLSGQRAMDRFSYQRLRWHIKKAAEVLKQR